MAAVDGAPLAVDGAVGQERAVAGRGVAGVAAAVA